MSESHYLLCLDKNCEKATCVARRDYENQIMVKDAEIERLKLELNVMNPNALMIRARHEETEKQNQAFRSLIKGVSEDLTDQRWHDAIKKIEEAGL